MLFLENHARAQDSTPLPEQPFLDSRDNPVFGTGLNTSSAPARTRWVAGASVYVLKPYVSNNTAYISSNAAGAAQSSTPFSWDFHPAPEFWLGFVRESGFGWRARYFHFDQDSSPARTNNSNPNQVDPPPSLRPPLPAPPSVTGFGSPGIVGTVGGTDRLTFISGLEINSIDIETLYELDFGGLSLLLSSGGRFMRLEQNYSGLLTNRIPGSSEIQQLDSHNRFNGGGPTVALQGRWAASEDGWSLFGLLRGSLLVGESKRLTAFYQRVNDPGNNVGGSFTFASQNAERSTDVLPVAELELGAEYSQHVGNARYLFRGAVVNQTYFDAGNASGEARNLGLFGVQLSVGVNY